MIFSVLGSVDNANDFPPKSIKGCDLISTADDHTVCLDAITGKPLWIHRLGQRVEEATLCIYRNKVIVLAGDGYVHANRMKRVMMGWA